jgi:hypothetical protein
MAFGSSFRDLRGKWGRAAPVNAVANWAGSRMCQRCCLYSGRRHEAAMELFRAVDTRQVGVTMHAFVPPVKGVYEVFT